MRIIGCQFTRYLHYAVTQLLAKVIRRSKSADGKEVEIHDDNPMRNTIVYDVEFPDGTVKEYSGANVIAENLYSQAMKL